MSNPTKQLRNLLVRGITPVSGTVSSVRDNTILVTTDLGTREVPVTGDTSYREGDKVRLINGVVVGRIRDTSTLPVYYV